MSDHIVTHAHITPRDSEGDVLWKVLTLAQLQLRDLEHLIRAGATVSVRVEVATPTIREEPAG